MTNKQDKRMTNKQDKRMTNKQALAILCKGISPNSKANDECIELCKKALEKQIPKKPTYYDSVPHGRCPNCRNAVKIYYNSPEYDYCTWCGQALDWRFKHD